MLKIFQTLVYGGFFSLVLASSVPVWAQVPPNNVSPGAIIQGIQQRDPGQTQTKPPKDTIDTSQPDFDPTSTLPQTKIQVQSITVKDATLLDTDEIDQLTAPYVGREVTLAELQELGQKLTALYREKGYVTSRVFIPPQEVEGGQLVLQATEGMVGEVSVEKGRFFGKRAVKPRIDLKTGDFFNMEDLKRSVGRINENPDLKARVSLVPGERTRETDLKVKIEDKFPVHLTPTFDNQGRRLVGLYRFGFTGAHNNVLGFGDRSLTTFNLSTRSIGVSEHYEMPIGAHGTKVGMDFAHSSLKLGREFGSLNITGDAFIYSPFISQELYRSDKVQISADMAFDIKNLDTDLASTLFTEDKIRVLRPELNYIEFDRFGSTFMRHELGIGLDVLNATSGSEILASRAGAGSKFLRYTGSLTRTNVLPWSTFGIFRVLGQVTPDRLISAEQFQVGGAFTVRGYTEGKLIGDKGVIASAEWRIPARIFPESWHIPHTNYKLRDNIQFACFTDFGAIFVNDPAVGVNSSQYAWGAGAGIRAKLTRFLIGRLDLAVPLIKHASETEGLRFHIGLMSEIF